VSIFKPQAYIQLYSDNLIPELPNTAHSCSRHCPAPAWLTSARPGYIIPVRKISTVLRVRVHCLSSSQRSITLLIISLFAVNYIVIYFWHSISLHCLNETAEPCELSDKVLKRREKKVAAECAVLPLTSLPLHPRANMDQVIWRGQYVSSVRD
jgi:hypothetical protein